MTASLLFGIPDGTAWDKCQRSSKQAWASITNHVAGVETLERLENEPALPSHSPADPQQHHPRG